jgi:5-methylcytosine-specific restriction protein A
MLTNSFENFIYKKEVDWSVLHEGFSIPVEFQAALQYSLGGLGRGESRRIRIHFREELFEAKVINQAFDERKFEGHPDVLQIRYSKVSALAQKLREVYYDSFNMLKILREKTRRTGEKKQARMPEEAREHLILYAGLSNNEFRFDCMTHDDIAVVKSFFDTHGTSEEEFEMAAEHDLKDSHACIEIRDQIVRVRRLDRSIGNSLKQLYQYRCQICAENFGHERGTDTAESHHIEAFVTSLNNDSNNILIVCPNHHTVIHKARPIFNPAKLRYEYLNGFAEILKLNIHLKVTE